MKHIPTLTALAAAAVLSLAACGGSGGTQPTPPASHSTSTSPAPAAVHTAAPGEPALMAVPGYDYANPPATAPSANEFIKSDPQHLQSASVHMVLHDGNMIAALALVQMKPQYASLPGLQQAIASGFVSEMAGSGAKVTTETIHTERVTIAKQGSTVVYCWFHAGALTVVTGDNGHDIRDYVEAYLQAAHA